MQKSYKISYLRLILHTVFTFLFMLGLIYLLAGRTDYWQGWVFSIILAVTVIFQSIILQKNPELAKERQKPGPGVKAWDKVLFWIFVPAILATMVVGILDSGRFGWSIDVSLYWNIIGFSLFFLSVAIFLWAMWANAWFSSMVRIQKDRNQQVAQNGPYKIVRHPGYVGAILMGIGVALSFGSYWALIPGIISALTMIVRTSLEDKTLQKELPGYADYVKITKYKLIPKIW